MKYLRKIKKTFFENETLRLALTDTYSSDVNGKPVAVNKDYFESELVFSNFGKSQEKFYQELFKSSFDLSFENSPVKAENINNQEIINQVLSSGLEFKNFLFYFLNGEQRVISFSNKALLSQLESTDIKDLTFKDLHVPFKAFYVSVEKQLDHIKIDGFIVICYEKAISIKALVLEKEINTKVSSLNCYTITIRREHSIQDAIDDAINKCVALNEEYFELTKNNQTIFEDYEEEKNKSNSDDVHILKYISKLAVNTIFFYNAAKGLNNNSYAVIEDDKRLKVDFSEKKSNKAIKKSIKKLSDANYYYILKNNSQKNKDIEINNKRKINKQFYVRGFYRRQPYGPREENKTKIIWIETYLKGVKSDSEDKMRVEVF